jgi:hypothetical protein
MKGKSKIKNIAEVQLYALWQRLCRARLTTTDRRLTGIHAGSLNTACGPDYRGAEFDLDGRRYRGDVEIHRAAGDWFRHGHHLDWRYDHVQLHLVAKDDGKAGRTVFNSKGLTVPTLNFLVFPLAVSDGDTPYGCRAPRLDTADLEVKLRHLSQQRLRERVNLFYRSALGDGVDQAFYRLLHRQLGRGQNADLFERMALMLPWSSVQQIKKRYHLGLNQWQQLLLYLAGLSDDSRRKVVSISGLTDQPCIPGHVWQQAGYRPAASPVYRLMGLARFIAGLKGPSLFEMFLDPATGRSRYNKTLQKFAGVLCPATGQGAENTWGASLIREIVGNVVIPALYYYAEVSDSEGFKNYLEQFYLWLPATEFYGCLNGYRDWPELPALSHKFYTAQSLLWLQDNYCRAGLCHLCPLGRVKESN